MNPYWPEIQTEFWCFCRGEQPEFGKKKVSTNPLLPAMIPIPYPLTIVLATFFFSAGLRGLEGLLDPRTACQNFLLIALGLVGVGLSGLNPTRARCNGQILGQPRMGEP